MTSTTNNNDHQQQEQEFSFDIPEFTIEEYEAEKEYFNDYDQEMVDVVAEADYDDFEGEEEEIEEDSSLLKLIVDVQTYLAEAPTDSPLFALQYKMYTYLKQRATEMGMDVSSLV